MIAYSLDISMVNDIYIFIKLVNLTMVDAGGFYRDPDRTSQHTQQSYCQKKLPNSMGSLWE